MQALHRVTVLGGGVLGGQIAWHCAYKGRTVTVYDHESCGNLWRIDRT